MGKDCIYFPAPANFLNLQSCIGGWIVWFLLIFGFSCIYSFIMNKTFGHSTYWKKSVLSNRNLNPKNELKSIKFKRKPSKENLLLNIDEHILMLALNYLTIKDLFNLGIVSRWLNNLVQSPSIWKEYEKKIFQFKLPDDIYTSYEKPSNLFFLKVLEYPKLLAKDKFIIIIDYEAYNVENFILEHPGGDALIRDYLGQDATLEFQSAQHSPFAHQLMDALRIWSPRKVLGSLKGVPYSLKRIKLFSNANKMKSVKM